MADSTFDYGRFAQLLGALNDAQNVKAAEAELKKGYFSKPHALVACMKLLVEAGDKSVRLQAATAARKLVRKHWNQLDNETRTQIRQGLLETAAKDDEKLLRHQKAHVIAAVAKEDFDNDEKEEQWPQLLECLKDMVQDRTSARRREVGVFLISTLLQTMPDFFQASIRDLLQLLSRTLQDQESIDVRINSMEALAGLALVMDTDEDVPSLQAFQATVPHMAKNLQSCIQSGDDDNTSTCFKVLQELLSYEIAFFEKHFGDLLKLMIQIASNTSIDDDARTAAIEFLMQAVSFRKYKVQKEKLGEPMAKMALEVITEAGDLSNEDEERTPAKSALQLIGLMSENLPPSHCAVPLLKAIGPCVTSSEPQSRRAGILALGVCTEGAPDFIATQLKEVLPVVMHLLEDPDVRVRSATLTAVSYLADDLAEDMGKEHARLIPAMVKNFDLAVQTMRSSQPSNETYRESANVVKHSCVAVDSLIEGLDQKDAALYVDSLVPRFSQMFHDEDYKVRMASISAVGAIASASGDAFKPYFKPIVQAIEPYMLLKESEDDLSLRGIVTESIGKIASAAGADMFRPLLLHMMKTSEEALHLDDPRLKETSYILWSTLAKVYKEEFGDYLNGVVKALFDCLEQDEVDDTIADGEEAEELLGKTVVIGGQKIEVAGANGKLANGDDADDMDDDDDDNWDDLGALSAAAQEKEIAVEVLGDVLTHTKVKYLPFMEQTIEAVVPLLDHSYEGIRKSAVGTLWRAYACLFTIAEQNGMAKWQSGLPVKVAVTEDLVKLGQVVVMGTLALWEEESDRATVTDIERNIAATLNLCGPALLMPSPEQATSSPLHRMTSNLALVLTKSHPCQQDDEGDESEIADAESAEYDWLVIETALEVVAALSNAMGEQFAELWQVFEKPIFKYASSSERLERSSAVGTISECIQHMGAAVSPYTKRLMAVLLKRLRDEDLDTKSNACFGIGLLCEHSTVANEILPHYPAIMTTLEPLFSSRTRLQSAEAESRLLDNAAGCVARMIKKAPTNVPLGEVLPRLVEVLPLKEDFRENEPVYEMLISLYQAQEPTVMGLTGTLMPVFASVLSPPEDQLTKETRAKIEQLVQYLRK